MDVGVARCVKHAIDALVVVLEMSTLLGISWVVGVSPKMGVFVVYTVTVALSNDGGECWEVECSDTSKSI